MEDSHPSFDIRPGEGIGPFALGMTRDEARAVARREFGVEAQARDSAHPDRVDFMPKLGIELTYDADGRCVYVQAEFGYLFEGTAGFLLFGKPVNWLPADQVVQLCREHWRDVENWHYWCEVPSAGLRMTYFDTPSDGCFSVAAVFPARRGQ